MIELRTLGGTDLRSEEGDEVRSVLAQPKRLALLIYVTLADSGFQRRDALFGLFWPEADQEHARASLRQALRYLRRGLGDGVLVNRGLEEVGIDQSRLHCDAAAFEKLLREGQSADALGLYGGDLLPGFFVADAPGFERWLEAQRARLREAAKNAAWKMATSAEEEGRLAEAKDWARWAVERSPANELALRRLITMLDRFGDWAAALKVFETFSRTLQADYGLDPSPETVGLIEAIRARKTMRRPPIVPPGRSAAQGPAATGTNLQGTEIIPEERRPDTSDEDADSNPGRHSDAFTRVATRLRRLTSRSYALDPQRVLVAVFENQTGKPALDPVGCMAADWIAQGLAQVGGLKVIPLTAAMASARHAQNMSSTREDAARVQLMAAETGAGTIVSGAFYAEAAHIQFMARVTDAARGEVLQSLDPISAPIDAPLPAIEALQERVLIGLVPRLNPRMAHVRVARQPPSYGAYRAYVEGLELFVRGAWQDALSCFQRSAAIDASYKLPRIVSAIAHWNLGNLSEADAIAQEVGQNRQGLGHFEDAVLDTVLAWLSGDWGAAHEAVMRQARLAPGSIPHFQVAEEARRLNRPREAVNVLSQIAPDRGEMQGWIFYWIELTHAYHRLGWHRRELRSARKARALHPDHPAALLIELRALAALGRIKKVYRRLDETLALPQGKEPLAGALMREAALELRAHGRPEPAKKLFERSLQWYLDRPPDQRHAPAHRRELARAYYYAGRWNQAQEMFEDLAAEDERSSVAFHHGHLQANLDQGYLGVLAVRRRDEKKARQIARELATLRQPYLFGSNTYWRAAMAALKNEKAPAVALLRHAFAEGLPHEMFIHTDIHFEGLRTYSPFQDLMRPVD